MLIADSIREDIYTVSRLTNEAKFLLENQFGLLWVEGEISNFAAPNSGHWYFSLKDGNSQVRCAMFRGQQRKLGFLPKDGMHVLLRVRVSLYENRGEFQLIVEDMEERGEGKLRRAFELLKKKLESQGLFKSDHKKSIPLFPNTLGVVTSATGAAIHDILNVLKRRYPNLNVIIYPTLVQGKEAASTIVEAIQMANQRKECDVIIVARGGGSLEDLWPFNEEIVALAIFQSEIPIISAVGHEVDFTIADFVADLRAPTPSAAAELVTPDRIELIQNLKRQYQHLLQKINQKLAIHQQQINWTQKHLYQQHPKRLITEKMQQLDFREATFAQLITKILSRLQANIKEVEFRLQKKLPLHHIQKIKHQIDFYQHQLVQLIQSSLTKNKTQLGNAAGKLDAISPLATLKRGFAITTDSKQNIIRDIHHINKGDSVNVKLSKGELVCTVDEVKL